VTPTAARRAQKLCHALETGDAIALQHMLRRAGGRGGGGGGGGGSRTKPKKKDKKKGGGKSFRFSDSIEEHIGQAQGTYDRTPIDVGLRIEQQLPPLGEVLLRINPSMLKHQWKPVFWIFDRDVLLLHESKKTYMAGQPPLKSIPIDEGNFNSYVTGKEYKNSGWVFSFKLCEEHPSGSDSPRVLAKIGHQNSKMLTVTST
jgi:hypothetical protein